MANPPHRALRIILGIFSLFTAAAGLLISSVASRSSCVSFFALPRLKFPLCCSS